MADPLAQLEAAYCPPLDPALLSAILSDYDLDSPSSLYEARTILDQLKESAALEEATDFDPSGTGAHNNGLETTQKSGSGPATSVSTSTETDMTSISKGISSLDLDDSVGEDENAALGRAEDLEMFDEATKFKLLQDLFGKEVTTYTIKHTLKKCGGKWQAAMEELLNHVYFNNAEYSDDGKKISSRGIDGFAEDQVYRRAHKGKGKKRQVKGLDDYWASSAPASPLDRPSTPTNRWKNATEDVEFISSRMHIPAAIVSSTYNEKSASVPQTIGALLKSSMEESKFMINHEAAVTASAQDLSRDFPNITPEYIATLVRLTHPSAAAAQELAGALTAKSRSPHGVSIQVIPKYAPILLNNENASRQAVAKEDRAVSSSPPPPGEMISPAAKATAYDAARLAAFARARAAHRKAKSNHLMGGAAAYYGEIGREYTALSLGASANAMDSLAARQSSPSELDLHGIDVLNAVRISQAKVHQWWDGLGENRVNGRLGAADRSAGYRIIVGLGKHSEGGKGKLGPAVSKMLRQDGWRSESAGAVIIVRGRAK